MQRNATAVGAPPRTRGYTTPLREITALPRPLADLREGIGGEGRGKEKEGTSREGREGRERKL